MLIPLAIQMCIHWLAVKSIVAVYLETTAAWVWTKEQLLDSASVDISVDIWSEVKKIWRGPRSSWHHYRSTLVDNHYNVVEKMAESQLSYYI